MILIFPIRKCLFENISEEKMAVLHREITEDN